MIDLERALADLAGHLDHPAGDHLTASVRDRIAAPARVDSRSRKRAQVRVLVTIAAVFLAIVAATVAIAPVRHAVADWLGIGAVEVRRTEHPLPTGSGTATVPGAPSAARDAAVGRELAAARHAVQFAIATPGDASAGALAEVDVDRRVPGGLVVLRYPRFTIVEIAGSQNGPTIAKFVDPAARVEPATVDGQPGLWISGAHEIGYFDRTGRFATDTVRRSGPVLLWQRAGVTYRIEGLARLADAQRIARSLR